MENYLIAKFDFHIIIILQSSASVSVCEGCNPLSSIYIDFPEQVKLILLKLIFRNCC